MTPALSLASEVCSLPSSSPSSPHSSLNSSSRVPRTLCWNSRGLSQTGLQRKARKAFLLAHSLLKWIKIEHLIDGSFLEGNLGTSLSHTREYCSEEQDWWDKTGILNLFGPRPIEEHPEHNATHCNTYTTYCSGSLFPSF